MEPASTVRHAITRAFITDSSAAAHAIVRMRAGRRVIITIPEVVQSVWWYPELLEDQRVAIVRSEDTPAGIH